MQEAIDIAAAKLVLEITCDCFSEKGWVRVPVYVPSEREVTIYVNQKELVTILCTPTKLNFLVLGFLYSEGIISGMRDVAMMRVCDDESEVDVRLANPEFEAPKKRKLTSGCGGGYAFQTGGKKVESELVIAPEEVFSLLKQFQDRMDLYRYSGGVHASALSDTRNLLVVSEDIGRHNTLDKIQGECLLKELPTRDTILLGTGRISSEMLLKVAKMQVPLVVSRHSPTGGAVLLAQELGITLVGRARGNRLSVYSHPERLGCATN